MEFKLEKEDKVILWSGIIAVFAFLLLGLWYPVLNSSYMFSDFAETISYCITRNPYNGVEGIYSIYPPIAFLPFYPFALICKSALKQYIAGDLTLVELVKKPSYIVSYILFFIICISLVLFLAQRISKFKGVKLICLYGCIIAFAPIIYCFFRANNIISAVILVMLFFWLYNSEVRWQREIANVCLAAAISIKIYPALIILFFIKDRRFLDLLKTFVYALLFIFIPFLLIEGGFNNIKEIWANFTRFNTSSGRYIDWSNISLDSFASKLSIMTGISGLHGIVSKLLRYGMILATIVVFILSKNSKLKMQSIAVSLLTYELFMGVSYAYTLTFLIIPMIYYFVEYKDLSKVSKIYYLICFAVIGFPFWTSSNFFFIATIGCMCLLIKCYVDLILSSRKAKA